MMHRDIPLSPRSLLLLLVLLPTASKTATLVHAFSPATTAVRQQHQVIIPQARHSPRPHYLNSRLDLFGRRTKNQAENIDQGDDDSKGHRSRSNSNDANLNNHRWGILRTEVKKLDSTPERAKEIRNRNEEDRHAWKKKNKTNNNKYLEKAIYRWRGLTQKLRYAIHRNTIYVLECENGKYYVGSTKNRKQRYREHFDKSNRKRGSKWTRLHKPIRVIAEYKRIPSRYLMGMESQKTSEWMFEHGVNNVRGAGFCVVKEFTTEDLGRLTTFLGHYNQLDYDSLGKELEKVLPRPHVAPASKKPKNKKKKRSLSPQDPNETQLTNKDVAAMATSFKNRKKDRNYKNKKRRKERNAAKANGETKCYNCGQPGHWANECPYEGISPASDASGSFANRWESDTVTTSHGYAASESVLSEITSSTVGGDVERENDGTYPNEGIIPASDARGSSKFANQGESDAVTTSHDLTYAASESVLSENLLSALGDAGSENDNSMLGADMF